MNYKAIVGGPKVEGCTLYITLYPCNVCAKDHYNINYVLREKNQRRKEKVRHHHVTYNARNTM